LERSAIVEGLRFQARVSAEAGSPIYAELLERAARDAEQGGPVARVLDGFEGHPILDAVALRLAGAVHALALSGHAPELAACYPTTGGRFEPAAAAEAFLATVAVHAETIRSRLHDQLQTNEVRRCAALLPGFLRVARHSGLPLRVREIGSSAGLNLLWDRYAYALGPHRWGAAGARPRLEADWEGPPPDLDAGVCVTSRAGCDVAPIDLRDPAERLKLESFVWPDQPERLALLREAIALARRDPPPVARVRAGDWLAGELASPEADCATVLFQSVMWWYLPEDERRRITGLVEAAGARATPREPLAWLRFEPPGPQHAEVRLRIWPGGDDRLLATAHHHGRWVRWLG
jgi:hypothetical protein